MAQGTPAAGRRRLPPPGPRPAPRGALLRPGWTPRLTGQEAAGFTNSRPRRQRRRRPALPACPALTSWAAAADRAEFRAPRRARRPGRRSRPLGASGAPSAFKAFRVSESTTEGEKHPPSLKPLLNGEESARSRHLITRMYPLEPIRKKKIKIKKKRGGRQETPASSYCASASRPQPPAPLPKGRRVSRGACARPPWKRSLGGASGLAHARRERRLWPGSPRGLSTLVTCRPASGFEAVRAPIAAESLAGGAAVGRADFGGGLSWCGGRLGRQAVNLGRHEACTARFSRGWPFGELGLGVGTLSPLLGSLLMALPGLGPLLRIAVTW